jgi:murein DD-endopeptidase MepM/ murein hydrolase activator NlpD
MTETHPHIEVLKKHGPSFHPVIPFNDAEDRLLQLDFTENNKELPEDILQQPDQFIQYINQKLQQAQAKYGIGGYAEHRTVYRYSKLFDAEAENEEPRRVHLGIDIWGKPQTAVMAPLDGVVHSFAFNNRCGDYGVTIILTHNLDGIAFHTLYGHLSLNDIKNIREGERVRKGDVFACFGLPMENGQWPPHLHFQVITDIGEWKGDFPGVCKFSDREKWLAACPDPDLILQLNKYL